MEEIHLTGNKGITLHTTVCYASMELKNQSTLLCPALDQTRMCLDGKLCGLTAPGFSLMVLTLLTYQPMRLRKPLAHPASWSCGLNAAPGKNQQTIFILRLEARHAPESHCFVRRMQRVDQIHNVNSYVSSQ